jgi:hypothetical protein
VTDGQPEPGYYTFMLRQNNGQVFNLKTKKAEDRARWIQEILKVVNKRQGSIEIADDFSPNHYASPKSGSKSSSQVGLNSKTSLESKEK